uniref:Glutaredoxin-2, mitochondrial n=1 Tax=Buteo japonicus TaxID=224669 RepID=A0A8C0BMX0_9AVES
CPWHVPFALRTRKAVLSDFKLLCFLDCSILLKYTDLKSKHTDLNVLLDLQKIISDNCVVIFSKTTCFYCKMSKKLFEDMNVNYTAVELDMNTNGSQFQDILEQMTGGRTVPRVFVNGTFVGGATDTQKLHEEGKLLPLVHQCQVKRKSSTAI